MKKLFLNSIIAGLLYSQLVFAGSYYSQNAKVVQTTVVADGTAQIKVSANGYQNQPDCAIGIDGDIVVYSVPTRDMYASAVAARLTDKNVRISGDGTCLGSTRSVERIDGFSIMPD